jgi:hypothetical protein
MLAGLLAASMLIWPMYDDTWTSLSIGSLGFGMLFMSLVLGMKILTWEELAVLRTAIPRRGKGRNLTDREPGEDT